VSYIFSTMKESVRAITSQFGSFLGSILTVFLAMLVAGSFAVIIKNTSIALEKLKSEATVEIYLSADIDSTARENLRDLLVADKLVMSVKYISKEAALFRLRQTFGPEMVAGLKTNPLPESFELSLNSEVYEDDNFAALVDSLGKLPGVDDIGYVPTIISRLKMLFNLMTALGLVMGILVALATAFIVGNTIHVKIADRRQTFYIMRLVGAGPGFIRSPYLLIGALIGFIGGGLAIICIKLAQTYFSGLLVEVVFLSPLETACFFIAGGLFGLIGSHLALKRFMKA
jgi:cell division transport system permease protein